MQDASIVLVALPQSDGQLKPRPALVLRAMPPFQDLLLAGISSQLQQAVPAFDELLRPSDSMFAAIGLRVASLVRLGFLAVISRAKVLGTLGTISSELHNELLMRLCHHLLKNL